MRQTSLRRIGFLTTAAALAFAVVGCGDPAPAPSTPSATKTDAAAAAPEDESPSDLQVEGTTPGDLVPAFVAKGLAGGAEKSVSSQTPGAVTVYCVGSTECPYTNKYAARLQQIEADWTAKGAQFVWLYSNRTETAERKTEWHAEKKLGGVFVIDGDAAIARALGASRTPEIVVTDAKGTITYRGAVDDGGGDPARAKAQYLTDAIAATLAGRAVENAATTPAG